MVLPFCPHCGFDLARDEAASFGATFSDPRAPLRHAEKPIRLSPTERMIAHTLIRAQGAWVGRNAIYERIGWDENDNAQNLLSVYVHRLRRRLKDSGVNAGIECLRGHGVRWVEPVALAEAA
jgi:DNA-binding response OmpR family regulator